MTTIIGIKEDNKLIIAGDKRSVGGFEGYSDTSVKVLELDGMLIGTAGDHLNKGYLSELYFEYKEKHKQNNEAFKITRSFIMGFYKYLIENVECLKEDGRLQMLVMHPDFQIGITNNSQMIEMDSRNMLAIGSGGTIAMGLKAIQLDTYRLSGIDISDMFRMVSVCDIYTSKEFDKLELDISEKCTDQNNI